MKTCKCRVCGNSFHSEHKKYYCGQQCSYEAANRRRRSGPPRVGCHPNIINENRELLILGKKRCTKCRAILELSNFRHDAKGLGGKTSNCSGCLHQKDRAWLATEGGKVKRSQQKAGAARRAGVTPRHEIAAETQAARIKRMFEVHHRARIRAMVKAEARSSTELYRHKYRNSPKFQAKERLRRQINKAAKRDGVSELIRGAIRRDGQSPMVEQVLGYSIADFMQHMERQFAKGMTWGHWRRGEIHIDHIVPQKEFDLSDPEEYRVCWSLPNLQPLWARENLRKSARRVSLL